MKALPLAVALSLALSLVFAGSPQVISTSSTVKCPASQANSPNTFSLFWITDTQSLSQSNSGLFMSTTQWIVKYFAACNGRMVVHTGDIIQNTSPVGGTYCNITDDNGSKWANNPQWLNASQAMSVLLKTDIPYTWDAGNHDGCLFYDATYPTDDGWTGWDYAAFNPSIVQKASLNWVNASWVGSNDQGMSTAVTFSGGGRNFLLINIQFNGVAELAWAQGILSNPEYANYYAIITTHGFIDEWGQISDPRLTGFASDLTQLMSGYTGQQGQPDVFMTLNGHYDSLTEYGIKDQAYHTTTASGVHELMFDRQGEEDSNGAATVAILTFDVKNGKVYMNAFDLNDSPSGKGYTHLTGTYRFVLNQPFSPEATKMTVSCTRVYVGYSWVQKSLVAGSPTATTCKVKVTGYFPAGTVNWSQTGTGSVSLNSTTCTLSRGRCSVAVTGTTAGKATIRGAYSEDLNDQGSSRTAALTVKKAPTVTTISCTESSFGVGAYTTCTATLTSGYPSPTGTVTWSRVSGTGRVTFSSMTCTPSSGTLICSVTVTGTHAGSVKVKATYGGDSNNLKSAGTLVLRDSE